MQHPCLCLCKNYAMILIREKMYWNIKIGQRSHSDETALHSTFFSCNNSYLLIMTTIHWHSDLFIISLYLIIICWKWFNIFAACRYFLYSSHTWLLSSKKLIVHFVFVIWMKAHISITSYSPKAYPGFKFLRFEESLPNFGKNSRKY